MLQVTRQEQQQKLALTQSMQLSIRILQMGTQALEHYVQQELLENPFLDLDTPSKDYGIVAYATSHPDTSLDTYAHTPSLSEYLIEQLPGLGLTQAQNILAEKLVYCLDDSGFLGETIDELASWVEDSIEHVRDIIPLLRTLKPTGVFSASLLESLALQLHERGVYTTEYSFLLANMGLIADGRYDEVCVLCKVGDARLREMLSVISQLEFRPCFQFDSYERVAPNIPDIIMLNDRDESVLVELNPDALPTVILDDGLFSTTSKVKQSSAVSRYYQDCYHRAAWLVAALQKRANTMLAIGNELAKLQSAFILSGKLSDRVPLQMQTIASRLGLNKSTISRALANRSIKTAYGVYDAKVFFVRKANPKLESTTIDVLLQQLDSIVGREISTCIYSDQDLCNQLAEKGLQVSRRSVSNYRKMLNIPSSAIRRKKLRKEISSRKPAKFHF